MADSNDSNDDQQDLARRIDRVEAILADVLQSLARVETLLTSPSPSKEVE